MRRNPASVIDITEQELSELNGRLDPSAFYRVISRDGAFIRLLDATGQAVGGGGGVVSAAWATTWDLSAQKDLGEYTITGALALTSDDTNAAVGGYTQAVVIANGANIPTFDGATLADWVNTAGARNFVTLFRAGNSKFWAIGANLGTALQIPTAPTVSVAPQIVSAITGTGLTWLAPTVNGYPAPTITYDVLANGSVVATNVASGSYTTPAAGTSMVVRATVTNASGSVQSSSAAVSAIATVAIRLTTTGATESGSAGAGWNYVTTVGDSSYGGTHGGISTLKIPAGQDGYFEYTVAADPTNLQPHIGMKSTGAIGGFAATVFGVYGQTGGYQVTLAGAGGNPTTARSVVVGDAVRVERVGSTGYVKINGTIIQTYTGISTGDMYLNLLCAATTAPANNVRGQGVV